MTAVDPTFADRQRPRAAPRHRATPPRDEREGLLLVFTGDGKGKTTAALGILVRAAGRDMRVGLQQFVKGPAVADYGEQVTLRRLGIDVAQLGAGCTLGVDDTTDDRALACAGWSRCAAALAGGTYDVLVLDELTHALRFGWLDAAEVVAAIDARPSGTHVVVTGRHVPDALLDAADLVTEMRDVKHPWRERRVPAQAGLDV